MTLGACSTAPDRPGASSPAPSESPASLSDADETQTLAGSASPSARTPSSDVPSAVTETQGSEPSIAAPTAKESRILIAYFSHTGNTETVAELLRDRTGGDLYRIESVVPYPEGYDAALDIAQRERDEATRPELAEPPPDLAPYATVFLGFPIWWGDMPMAVHTFVESVDMAGKTLVPFCTSGSSGFGSTLDDLATASPDTEILAGLHIRARDMDGASGAVDAWLGELALPVAPAR
jgi:flavodoxin